MKNSTKKRIQKNIKLTLKASKKVYKVSNKFLHKGLKYIRKQIKTPKGKIVTVAICVTLVCGFMGVKSMNRMIQTKRAEAKVKMYKERLEYLKGESESSTTEEVVDDSFIELRKTLKGYNINPFIEGVQAKPQSATYKVLVAHGVEYIDSKIGADHIQLTEKQKMDIMNEIENEVGRSAYRLFNPLDVTQISGLSIDKFESLLPEGLKGLGDKLYEAEHPADGKYPVNGLLVLAITRLESADGTSRLSVEKNNLAGLGAREGEDKDGNGIGDITDAFNKTKPNDRNNPDWKAYGKEFNSKDESMLFLINKLRNDYINPKGDFYNGDKTVSIFDINKKYCTMATWSYKVLDKIEKSEEHLGLNY